MANHIGYSVVESGTVTAPALIGDNTLCDNTKNWGVDVHKNRLLRIYQGAGTGQLFVILGNSGQALVIRGTWVHPLDTTSKYEILSIDIAQVLRDVLNQGLDISLAHPLEVHDPAAIADIAAVEAKLDDPATGLAAIIAGIVATIAEVDANEIKIDALEGKLDFAPVGATFTYLNAGGEQIVFTFTPTANSKLHTIWLDLATLTQNTTIRLKHQIDGVNYRTFETFNWTTGMDDGVYFRDIAVMSGRPIQVTIQETADEGADRAIPYYYMREER